MARAEQEGSGGISAFGHMSCVPRNSGGQHPCVPVSYTQPSLLGYPPGPGVGDGLREAPGSPVGHAEDLVFPLRQEAPVESVLSQMHDLIGPLLPGSLGRENREQGKVGRERPLQRLLQRSHSSTYSVPLPNP